MPTWPKSVALLGLAVIVTGLFGTVIKAETPELTDEKLSLIKQSCLGVQSSLQRIQHNDAATRVNRGQDYESLLSKLMTPLNSRSAANGFNTSAGSLINTTTLYSQAVDTFKKDYDDYDDSLTSALKTKCQSKPVEFYNNLTKARALRGNLANDVANLNSIIENYHSFAVKLKGEVK